MRIAEMQLRICEKRSAYWISQSRSPVRNFNEARVPGIGLLNRTLKSWVERHEVQLLRGPPKKFKIADAAD